MSRFKPRDTPLPLVPEAVAPSRTVPSIASPLLAAVPSEAFLVPKPLVRNFLQTVGYVALLLYVFSWASFINEIGIGHFGVKPYISMISGPIAAFCLLVGGSLQRGLKTRAGRFWLILVIWMFIGAPFSVWRSDSIKALLNYAPRVHFIFFYACAALFSVKDCRVMVYANAAGGFILLLLCFRFGSVFEGRFAIPNSSFSNPNALALQLLIAACLFTMLVMHRNMFVRLAGLVGIGACFAFIFKTGSRGSFVAIIIVLMALFFTVQQAAKVKIVLVTVFLAVPALLTVPQTALNRIINIAVKAEASTDDATFAASSQLSREELLKNSIKYTIAHPIVGVGMGEFGNAVWGDGEKVGVRTSVAGTHNSFTQISSECGIPALICYSATVFLCIRMNRRLYKQTRDDPALWNVSSAAMCLYLTMIGYAVNTFFFHTAYGYYLATLAGISVALQLATAGRLPAAAKPRI